MSKPDQITDKAFLTQFENLTLDSQYFNHIGHVRLAWLYIHRYGLEVAMAKTFAGIPAYAGSLGAADKFHATITDAIVRIIAQRMATGDEDTWQAFIGNHADLVDDALAVIRQHYSQALLDTKQARLAVLQPDLAPI